MLSNMATVRWRQGDLAAAIELYTEALDVFEGALGPEHPSVAQALDNLGVALFSAGRHDEALTRFMRAQVLVEERLGPEHHEVAKILIHVVMVYEALGAFDDAYPRARRAARITAAALGDDHGEVGHALATLARVEAAREHYAEALEPARRALEIYEHVGVGAIERAGVLATLARVLVHAHPPGHCRSMTAHCNVAFDHARRAKADYEAAGPLGESGLADLHAWAEVAFGDRL